jgi:hypothetical protein
MGPCASGSRNQPPCSKRCEGMGHQLVVLSRSNRRTKLPHPVDRPELGSPRFFLRLRNFYHHDYTFIGKHTHHRNSHILIDGPCIPRPSPNSSLALNRIFSRHFGPSLAFSLHARLDVHHFLRRRSASSSSFSHILHPMNGPSYSLIETSPRPCFD